MAWQDIVRTVAPTVATGLGGPLAGVVAKIVAGALFPDDPEKQAAATPQTVIDQIATMSDPADIAKMKQAELELRKFEADNNFRFAQLEAASAQSARDMRVTALGKGNETADILSYAVLASFLVIALIVLIGCGYLIVNPPKINDANGQMWVAVSGLIGAIVGYFSANAQQVVGFYFGSSASSAAKTEQIAQTTATAVQRLVERPVAQQGAGTSTVTRTDIEPGRTTITEATGGQATGAALSDDLMVGVESRKPIALASPVVGEARWDACINFVLEREGGYVDDPSDHGGATNMGITIATLSEWRHNADPGATVTAEDVRKLSKDEAKAIYRAKYWNVLRCDALPPGVDLCMLDIGVLSGPSRAAKMLQKIAGLTGPDVDGVVGPQTIRTVSKLDPRKTAEDLSNARQAFYNGLVAKDASQERFLKGWTNRVNLARARALEMVQTWA